MDERSGRNLVVTLASTRRELHAAQALRRRCFRGANEAAGATRSDADRFDPHCDHLIVIDQTHGRRELVVVGTYRLLRRTIAERCGGFYSQSMFDLGPLLAQPGEALELGRSCVDPAFRDGRVITRLWQGIAAYAQAHDVAWLFGCASLPGTDPEALADVLTWLDREHAAPAHRRPVALPARRVAMRRAGSAVVDASRIRAGLPPLLKAYIRLGGEVGDGAVVDHDLGTIPVCVVLEEARVAQRYREHFLDRAPPSPCAVHARPTRVREHRPRALELA